MFEPSPLVGSLEHDNQTNKPSQSDIDYMLMNWQKAKSKLTSAKEYEMKLRKELTDMLFPEKTKGTQRYDLGMGYSVKLVHKLNYNLSDELTQKVLDAIEDNHPGEAGTMISSRLVKWKPTLSQTEYKQLNEADRRLIDTALTITDASPELELEEPKVK